MSQEQEAVEIMDNQPMDDQEEPEYFEDEGQEQQEDYEDYNQAAESDQHFQDQDDQDVYGQELERDQDEMLQDGRDNAIFEQINLIERQCQETKMAYCDPEFDADDKALYIDSLNPPEYAQDIPVVEWRRPHEIYTNDDPCLMRDPNIPGDVKQGILNDQWLLGTFSTMGMNPELLKNLIVHDGLKFGFAVFQFFKNGRWQFVTVDSRIPYNITTKTPLYGHCADPQEFWVPLIEKAYAKLHGNYEILNEGRIEEALVDMTGGVAEKYDLTRPDTKAAVDSGQFWKDLRKSHQQGFIVVCENSVEDDGKPVDGYGVKGIQYNKAYGMLKMADLPDMQGLQLVYMRNPWGQGNSVWSGAFADEDEAWDDYKGLKERLDHSFKLDGNWWMRFEDWKANYNRVYVCKIFPSSWTQYSVACEWKGNTAGGNYPNLHQDQKQTEENKDQASAALDTCDKWFNNPQFRLSVTKRTQVIISLMQEDSNISKRPIIPVNYLVVRVKSRRDRLWEIEKEDIVLEAAPGGSSVELRELTCTLWLSPQHDKKDVHYIIVPNTELEGNRKEEERPFFLRVFASESIQLVQLPNTVETQFTNKWGINTCGGKLGLESWCRNPQYFLNIQKPTHIKVILRKKGGRRIKLCPIGFTITKANAPTVPPESTIIGKGKKGVTVPSSISKNGQTYAATIATMNFKKEKGSDAIPDFELPRLAQNLERKLQILDNEWSVSTSYTSDDAAALYCYFKPTQGPFVIVPSMANNDKQAEFTLTVFSSNPIEMQPLAENMNIVISGKWTALNNGGCHLNDKEFTSNSDAQTWVNNPKFILKLDSKEPVEVKITLSRPEGPWKKPVGKNLVGAMIGFYVHQSGVVPTKHNVLNKEGTKFVPWNEITETLTLDGNDTNGNRDGYVIMPCTYESSKDIVGPFMIAVSTTVEFTLTQLD